MATATAKQKVSPNGTTKDTATAPPATISIPAIKIEVMDLFINGTSPLICHRWSDKAKKMMLDKQMKKAKTAREAKNPEMDFFESLYWLDGMPESPTMKDVLKARFGFPVVGFKSAAVSACTHVDGLTKVFTRGAFHIDGEYAVIDGIPDPREDMVRIAMGTADIRYRGEFKEWSTTLRVRYNASTISPEQVANLFNIAGFAVGVGEWRPEKDGSYGMFTVGG